MTTNEIVVIMTPDGRMDRKNASLYSGYSPNTLARYASNGTGPRYVKRGKVWYRKSDIDAWLNDAMVQSPAASRLLSVQKRQHQ